MFPISRDPPEGGTSKPFSMVSQPSSFPISRDPPEGGTWCNPGMLVAVNENNGFQFLGIPPKGELEAVLSAGQSLQQFPISRDPPEGGT